MSKERFNIEKAILHAKEVAEKNRRAYKNCPAELNTKGYTCEQCADEHEQLAKWLEELKQYRGLGRTRFAFAPALPDRKYGLCYRGIIFLWGSGR